LEGVWGNLFSSRKVPPEDQIREGIDDDDDEDE